MSLIQNFSSPEPNKDMLAPAKNVGMPADMLARRRMLLASLGKGATIAAAVAVPMQSLAAIGTLSVTANGKRCTISGNMSAVHSAETTTAICQGRSPVPYTTLSTWPTYNALNTPKTNIPINGGSGSFNENTAFSAIFGAGPITGLLAILTANNASDDAYWVAALLNGSNGTSALVTNFPYTAQEVINLYAAGGTVRTNALAFFKNFMSTVVV